MRRFECALGQKRYIHDKINKMPFNDMFVIDTKFGHSKQMFRKRHRVHQFGYDFGQPSTQYLQKHRQPYNATVWLDYCCTPFKDFVQLDIQLCDAKWVFMTFSLRGCRCWKSKLKSLCKKTPYTLGWTYQYHDTSPMLLVCYYRSTRPPKRFSNPVGQTYTFMGIKRRCQKLLIGPDDDENQLYLQFKDSNEPAVRCRRVSRR